MRRGAAIAALAVAAVGCGIKVARNLSATPPAQVIMDDACGLQEYFDAILTGQAEAPKTVRSTELEKTEGRRAAGGVTVFGFETDFQLANLRRVLATNWRRVPAEVMKAPRVEVEVRWAEKAAVRRVVTTEDALLSLGRDDSRYLPYHVCLSDLLFGAPLYRTRREMLGLPPLALRLFPDAGAADATPLDGPSPRTSAPVPAPGPGSTP